MKKLIISRLFLYRYRFVIGYVLLGLIFAGLVFLMPLVSPGGVSQAEMEAAVAADEVSWGAVLEGDVVNLPFRALQKLIFTVFGLSMYTVKLPAMAIGVLTGVFLVLLLNRWFKTNVAMITSGFVALSSFFLGVIGTGTAEIMMVFFLVLVIWAGAKLVGAKQSGLGLLLTFFMGLALICYSPLMVYLVLLVGIVSLLQPHLRFFIKSYNRKQVIVAFVVFGVIVAPLLFGAVVNGGTMGKVLSGGVGGDFWGNIELAFAPFFSFVVANVWGVLAPMFGLATVALTLIGVITFVGKLYTAKNVITAALVLFSVGMAGLLPTMAMLMFLPILLLVASGIEMVINKWYALFPENPYARLFGVFPIALFCVIALGSGLTHFFYGYLYVSAVAEGFENDISLVREYVPSGGVLIVQEDELRLRFYKILEKREMVSVTDVLPDRVEGAVATLGRLVEPPDLPLSKIITSPKVAWSDRLYIYNEE